MTSVTLSYLDFGFILVYFAAVIVVGYVSSRGQDDEGFLIAQRSLGTFSTFATVNASKTGSILMIFVALVYVWGIAALWYFVGVALGVLVFLPFALRLKEESGGRFYTLADYFKYNYGKGVARVASAITIFLMFGFLVLNLIAGTKIFVFFTAWPFWVCAILMMFVVLAYILMGGFKAVVKTDIIQYVAIVALLLILTLVLFDGSLIPVSEWNFFNADLATIVGFLLVGALSPFAMPDIWQRVYSTKNKTTLKRGLLLSIVVYVLVAFLLGLVALTVKTMFPDIDPDLALVHGFGNLLPEGLVGLSVVLLFAAIMSSIDTYIFTASSAVVQDFFEWNKERTVRNIKKVILLLAFMGTVIAVAMQSLIVSTYIFVSFILVLAVVVVATWIHKKIKPITLYFGFGVGVISIVGLLAYYLLFVGDIAPVLAIFGLALTILGLFVGGLVSRLRENR